MKDNKWTRLLAYVTGLVNLQLLLQNGYLAAENRILRAHLPTRLRLSDPQKSTLAETGKRLGALNKSIRTLRTLGMNCLLNSEELKSYNFLYMAHLEV